MDKLRLVGVCAGLVISSALISGCGLDTSYPTEAIHLPVRTAWSVGDLTAYSGVLREGVFIVCTSRFSNPGTYEYEIEGNPTIEKVVKAVSMEPGECKVVAEAKKNSHKGLEPSVTVTRLVEEHPVYLVRIDASCSVDCLVNTIPTTLTLSGSAGAIAKYYFFSSSDTSGNHGGTGTLTFALD